MKKVYLVLTNTGSALSRIIKLYTKRKYSHVSIALDEDLDYMYSFGRLKPYNPLIGGFVHEKIHDGTFKRFKNTIAAVYSLDVEDEQYEKIKEGISFFDETKEKYSFNIIGLFAVALHKKIEFDDSYYCGQFVKKVMQEAGVGKGLPEIIKPEDFKEIKNVKLEYTGLLRDYDKDKKELVA